MTTDHQASLQEANVLITGGTGEVGWGIAHQAIAAGAHAILPTRSQAGAAALTDEFGDDATVVVTELSTDAGIEALTTAIDRRGPLHHVVAPIGSFWNKGLTLDQPANELVELLDTYVVTQHRLARATLPRLERTGGSYTLITGAAGEHAVDGMGLLIVAVNAQFGLGRVLAHELRDASARFNEVRIVARIERQPRPGVVESKRAGTFFTNLMVGDRRSETLRLTPENT